MAGLSGGGMTLSELQAAVAARAARAFPDRDAHQPLLAALRDLGALAQAHLNHEQGLRGTLPPGAAAQAAVGGVLVHLADDCARNGLDLDAAAADAVGRRGWRRPERSS